MNWQHPASCGAFGRCSVNGILHPPPISPGTCAIRCIKKLILVYPSDPLQRTELNFIPSMAPRFKSSGDNASVPRPPRVLKGKWNWYSSFIPHCTMDPDSFEAFVGPWSLVSCCCSTCGGSYVIIDLKPPKKHEESGNAVEGLVFLEVPLITAGGAWSTIIGVSPLG